MIQGSDQIDCVNTNGVSRLFAWNTLHETHKVWILQIILSWKAGKREMCFPCCGRVLKMLSVNVDKLQSVNLNAGPHQAAGSVEIMMHGVKTPVQLEY